MRLKTVNRKGRILFGAISFLCLITALASALFLMNRTSPSAHAMDTFSGTYILHCVADNTQGSLYFELDLNYIHTNSANAEFGNVTANGHPTTQYGNYWYHPNIKTVKFIIDPDGDMRGDDDPDSITATLKYTSYDSEYKGPGYAGVYVGQGGSGSGTCHMVVPTPLT